ncbi:MAG: 2,3-diphosphoglycerate-dependent phosphoglycerate mutase [Myxococcales bacterium]|nr:2,3-diphosphoglycerate-dependent phosphoglycerate mutase [Myxococcales bacterium]
MAIKLVLLRHGQSTWNQENRFTGWTDVGLTEQGMAEAKLAGTLLKAENLGFDTIYTSLLKRAIHTMQIVQHEMDLLWVPVRRDWRLNERHYGGLQGLDKKETTEKHGADQVFIWRRSYDVKPPALSLDDPRHPKHDTAYQQSDIPLPASECLKDVYDRVLPFWNEVLAPRLQAEQRLLVVAHGNSLRALVKHLDKISDEDIPSLNIPTGIPLVYELDSTLQPISSRYLGDPEAARKAAEAVARQAGGH